MFASSCPRFDAHTVLQLIVNVAILVSRLAKFRRTCGIRSEYYGELMAVGRPKPRHSDENYVNTVGICPV